jgi:hypothetical protein
MPKDWEVKLGIHGDDFFFAKNPRLGDFIGNSWRASILILIN